MAEWGRILESYPYLAPAIKPGFRVHFDDVALVVDENRTDQLRAGGNGVVAFTGFIAFVELATAAGLGYWNGQEFV
jgi:hypothetical protein